MRKGFLFIIFIFFYSCIKKDKNYYTDLYNNNKDKFLEIRDSLRVEMKQNNAIYCFELESTGKRYVQYIYTNDSTEGYFENAMLSKNERIFLGNIMDDIGLTRIKVYLKDSTKYYFGQVITDTLIIFDKKKDTSWGSKIDSNVYISLYKS